MHEFSLASALVELVRRHVPTGCLLRSVTVEAGPLRGIDPQAMQMAWMNATSGCDFEGAALKLILHPWRLHCPQCQRHWQSDEPLVSCACGHPAPTPSGDDQMRLLSLEVTEPEATAAPA
jgi:Zn finger protein HypA/HybF involved in hydrogenase expression